MIVYVLPILAVVFGFAFVAVFNPSIEKNLKLLLAFSGAFLLSITVFELIPKIYDGTNVKTVGLFIMLGILLQIFLEFFSKGAEHGHVHVHRNENIFPWILFISLSIHAILEGFPINGNDNLLYGIIIHKIPVAIILTSFFFASNLSNTRTVLFLLLFAFMTPLGSYLSEIAPFFESYETEISALVVGIFLHISTTILFESDKGHRFNVSKLIVIVAAVAIAYFM
ncbi:MAG: ZIP family metal transporter [Bacteroidia bacterium]|nr:ZIP family metal transporter [Bacteroidia bacterium]